MYFHRNSRELYFLYKFLTLGPLGKVVACCLAFNASFFFFKWKPSPSDLTAESHYKTGQKIHFCMLEQQAWRGKKKKDKSFMWAEGRTGIPGPPVLMEKRHHCLAIEVRTQAHSSTKTHTRTHPFSEKQLKMLNTLLAFSSRSTGQTLIL